MKRPFILASLAALVAGCNQGPSEIAVTDAWARATAQPQMGAVYATVSNRGGSPDRLLSVSTPKARVAEMHDSQTVDGVARMRRMESVDVPADSEVQFRPGGKHVMLMGLSSRLQEGEHFPLTMTFERSGDIEVEVEVLASTAEAPAPRK